MRASREDADATILRVLAAVASRFCLTVAQLTGECQQASIANPRGLVAWIANKDHLISPGRIAAHLNRSRASIESSIGTCDKRLDRPEYAECIRVVRETLQTPALPTVAPVASARVEEPVAPVVHVEEPTIDIALEVAPVARVARPLRFPMPESCVWTRRVALPASAFLV